MVGAAAATAAEAALLVLLLFGYLVDDFVGDAEIFDVVAFDIDFWETHKLIAFRARLDDLLEGEVHPGIAHDQVSIQSLSVLEFDQHGVALGGVEQSEGKHDLVCFAPLDGAIRKLE